MTQYVFDCEWAVEEGADIVLGAQSIHCVVAREVGKEEFIEFYEDSLSKLPEWLSQPDRTYIGHNILTADLEVFRRLLGIPFTVGADSINNVPCQFIDTYTLSKRLNPDRKAYYYRGKSLGVHGLDAWGGRVGIPKPKVTDWTTKPLSVYLNRCREDVKINEAAYFMMLEEKNR